MQTSSESRDDRVRRWPWRRRPRWHRLAYEGVLGTSLDVQLCAASPGAARRAESAALAEVDRLDAILSGWSHSSELAHWLGTPDRDVLVSAELAEVLAAAEKWRRRTAGAFNPAAQAVVALLRDRVDEGATHEAELLALVADIQRPLWTVDRARRLARRLTGHAVSLDAIAKGYIVSRAASAAARVKGVTDVLLNVGGDIAHVGMGTVAVGVADPFAPSENAAPVAVIRLHDEALATSGGYRRGFALGGRRVSHLVDPRTGRPVEQVASASVVAPDCATADALSTACSVLAPAASIALADALPGVGCLLVLADGTIAASAAWTARTTFTERACGTRALADRHTSPNR